MPRKKKAEPGSGPDTPVVEPSKKKRAPRKKKVVEELRLDEPVFAHTCDGEVINECSACSIRDCPHKEPLHHHHDGCPACDAPSEEQPSTRVNTEPTARNITKDQQTVGRVLFYAHETTRLERIDLDEFGDYEPGAESFGVSMSRVDGAFVKVSASLRPSEREGFDGRALKERLRQAGARAVLLAVHPVAESPDREAKEESATALRPEDAITTWFDRLPVPEADRVAAREMALAILAAEGG